MKLLPMCVSEAALKNTTGRIDADGEQVLARMLSGNVSSRGPYKALQEASVFL